LTHQTSPSASLPPAPTTKTFNTHLASKLYSTQLFKVQTARFDYYNLSKLRNTLLALPSRRIISIVNSPYCSRRTISTMEEIDRHGAYNRKTDRQTSRETMHKWVNTFRDGHTHHKLSSKWR